jgi:ribonuclease HI
MSELPVLTIHTDGASRGNPGASAFAYVIARNGAAPIECAGRLGDTTNNQAEYTALVRALEHALKLGAGHRVVLHSDSELMVRQMKGEYKVKNGELRPLYERAKSLEKELKGGVTYVHVRRELNKRTDQLCNAALDGKKQRSSFTAAAAVAPAALEDEDEGEVAFSLGDEVIAILELAGIETPAPIVWDRIADALRRRGVRLPV